MLTIKIHGKYINSGSETKFSLTSHRIFCRFERQNITVGSDRVLSLNRKEVCFETGFSLAVFSKTIKAEFAVRGPRSAGSGSTTARNEGLVLWYRMC